eukprot:CAMPEP_0170202584 /NCGR_PEP_ID=MMETSP0116_2-20130129/777_1 /TAXON_ID=400756 /ORGANISM="Durinskia baltica, Strain CSIRO CS-38" /LENGTH=159 /DNA_ID=CAMNT_0010452857 /DNA_START=30 /DNA_END=509 /DNA_ORIENTATION=+
MTNCNTGNTSKRGSLSPAPRSRSRSVRRRGRSMIRKEHHEDRQLTPAPFKFGACGATATATPNGSNGSDARRAMRRPNNTCTTGVSGSTHGPASSTSILRAKSVEEESATDLASSSSSSSSSSHRQGCLVFQQDEHDQSTTRVAVLGNRKGPFYSHPAF